MFPTNIYPYIDLTTLNLDWIINEIKLLKQAVGNLPDMNEVLSRITALENYCDRLHNGLNSQYVTITNEYQNAIAAESNDLVALMDAKDNDVKNYIDNALAGLPGYYMYNPYTGMYSTITEVMMYLYDSQRVGITAAAFDALDMTATYYDGLQKTAYDFDMYGI